VFKRVPSRSKIAALKFICPPPEKK